TISQALEQQTATAEILQTMSRVQTDAQPVFEAIVRSAVRLCGASNGGVYRFDGELVHSVAHEGFTPGQLEEWKQLFPRPVGQTPFLGRAIATANVIRVGDLEAGIQAFPGISASPEALANIRARGARSELAVPMLRQNEVIGVIVLVHQDVN